MQKETGLKWLDISKLANEQNFVGEYDEEYSSPVLDEDKVSKVFFSVYQNIYYFFLLVVRLYGTNNGRWGSTGRLP